MTQNNTVTFDVDASGNVTNNTAPSTGHQRSPQASIQPKRSSQACERIGGCDADGHGDDHGLHLGV